MPDPKNEQQIRCGRCLKLLAVAGPFSTLHIKCPRCKTLNHFTHSPRAA
ncbi:Com family DNA-binding transcriptional regulator [Citrobacter portucalensis]|nr:Com family DNA-binding transcriptional regulator [Citrobacter portucalensis]MCX8984265.1 Com family DNA-binding transcriptional regulator [Citrobacter portucalensis]